MGVLAELPPGRSRDPCSQDPSVGILGARGGWGGDAGGLYPGIRGLAVKPGAGPAGAGGCGRGLEVLAFGLPIFDFEVLLLFVGSGFEVCLIFCRKRAIRNDFNALQIQLFYMVESI